MELNIRPWIIQAGEDSPETKDFRESIFCQANGYMGMRGFAPHGVKGDKYSRSTFVAGFFEYIRPGITDMVNQPDISYTTLYIDGSDVTDLTITDYSQALDMRDGALRWAFTAADAEGRRTRVRVTRFLSMGHRHVAAFRFELTPLGHDAQFAIETGIDCDVENLPISDDQCSDNTDTARIWGSADASAGNHSIYMETSRSGRGAAIEYRTSGALRGTACKGETAIADKVCSIYCYRDGGDIRARAKKDAESAASAGFDALLRENRSVWESLWDEADVGLDADDELQGAERYSIFQLLQAAPHNDPNASIGARALSHGRYKGCTFWDTEIFMLPFYLHTDPETAKNLLLYRYSHLQESIESAKRYSLSGARYSWMASDTGFEQCETWDTGCCEIHITADVAYAFGRYVQVTGDGQFFAGHAAEVFIQTARYWASRFTYNAQSDQYNLLFVKGPDEYCGVTNNNLFTIKLAAHNLQLAADAAARMAAEFPEQWRGLREKTGYDESESAHWRGIIAKTVVRYDDASQLYMQDNTFELLEPIDPAEYKDDDTPLYHKISFDRLQRYQALKQADVLMLMALLPDDFTVGQKKAAWDYYEPKTLHDSTLSFGAHALLASRLGLDSKAEEYFRKSCFLDLRDVMRNTAREGLHTAASGITWQALVFGFAGLWTGDGGLRCGPALPPYIRGMRFRVRYKGKAYTVSLKQGEEAVITEHG